MKKLLALLLCLVASVAQGQWPGYTSKSGSGLSSPVAVSEGGTGLTTGTSGGVLCYTAAGTLASSGVLTSGRVVLGGGAGACPSDSANLTWSSPALSIGAAGVTGALKILGSTSGTATIQTAAAAGTPTLTLPTATGTLTSSADNLSVFAATSSAQLAGVVNDETGSGLLVFGTSPTITTPTISGAISFPDGVKQTFNPDATNAGLNVGSQAGDPSAPANGDILYNSTTNKFRCYENGAWANCIGAAGGSALSGITAASGANTIASGNNHSQIWNWALTSNSVAAMTFGETSAATGGTSTNSIPNQAIGKFSTAAASTATPFQVYNRGNHFMSVISDAQVGTLLLGLGINAGGPQNHAFLSFGSALPGGTGAQGNAMHLKLYEDTTPDSYGLGLDGNGALTYESAGAGHLFYSGQVATRYQILSLSQGTALFSKGSADAVGQAFNIRKSRGTVSAPSVITTGDDLLTISGYGYVGATNTYQEAANITFDSTGTISDSPTGIGGIMRFKVATVGSEPAEVFNLTGAQIRSVNGSATAPAYSFDAEAGLGFYRSAGTGIGISGAFFTNFGGGDYVHKFTGASDIAAVLLKSNAANGTTSITSQTHNGGGAIVSGDNLLTLTGAGYVGAVGYRDAATILLDSTGTISNATNGIGGQIKLLTQKQGVDTSPQLRAQIGQEGHFESVAGTANTPTVSSCGTTPSITGTDNAALVTVGTGGAATSCTVTFGTAYTNAPVCVAQSDTDIVAFKMVTTTTTAIITASAAFTASSKLHVLCTGIL